MAIHSILTLRGPKATHVRTGREHATRIIVHEIADCSRDTRVFVVTQNLGAMAIRERRFTVDGYLGNGDCGRAEANAARELARKWAAAAR